MKYKLKGQHTKVYCFCIAVFWELRVPCFAFQWTFSYIGFPVELNTVYFIGAHNIPNANMNEDGPSMSVNFTSPGKLLHSFIILCLAGMPALGYVQREPREPWIRLLALLILSSLI